MFRSPSLPLHEYDDLSSPDPLATSFNDGNNARTSRFSSPIRRSASPSKYSTVLQDVEMATPRMNGRTRTHPASSPSRTVTEQTLSPWKIRVTVEAEQENVNGNARTMTRTVKIPLREASSPIENVKIERRGRKSQPGTANSKRSATPSRGRSNSRSRRQSVTDLDIVVLGDEGDSNDWTKQKSAHKRKPRQSSPKKKANNAGEPSPGNGIAVNESMPQSGNRQRRKKVLASESFEIREDSDEPAEAREAESPTTVSPELRLIDPNRVSMRSRSMSTRQRLSPPKDDTIEALMSAPAVPERLESTRQVSYTSMDSYPTPTPSVQSDEGSKEQQLEAVDSHEGLDTVLESEGFTMIDLDSIPSARHFLTSPPTTQPDSQEETPAHRALAPQVEALSNTEAPGEIPAIQAQEIPVSRKKPTPIPSYLTLPEGESDISSNVPSSPPIVLADSIVPPEFPRKSNTRQVTPQPNSSPRLPSPPKVLTPPSLQIDPKNRKTEPPTLASVVKAGIALQGVLAPKANTSKPALLSPYQQPGTPKDKLDDLFEGFDPGTRRELRAGLRLGEELAKRQRSIPGVQHNTQFCKTSHSQSNSKLQPQSQPDVPIRVWRGKNVAQHTPVTSVQQVEDMPEKQRGPLVVDLANETKKQRHVMQVNSGLMSADGTPANQVRQQNTPSGLDTIGRRERHWQLEREAVSREIENASSSQVILIESDDEDVKISDLPSVSASSAQRRSSSLKNPPPPVKAAAAEQDDGDVWLQEAEACNSFSSNLETAAHQEAFPLEEQSKQRDRAIEALSWPRRSLIPSFWKRGQDVADASTFLTNGDMTGLFFQQEKDVIKFGAGDIARQKRQTSSSFGVGSSAGKRNTVQEQPGADFEGDVVDEEPAPMHDQHQDESEDEDLEAEQSMLDGQLVEGIGLGDDNELLDGEEAKSVSINEEPDDSLAEGSFARDMNGFSFDEASPLPPPPIKIPVNFNDSSLSHFSSQPPPITCSSPSQAPEFSRPSTPRSAIKGSRLSLGFEIAAPSSERKVIFSEQSIVVDTDGCEGIETLRSASSIPTPRFKAEKEVVELLDCEDHTKVAQQETEEFEKKEHGWPSWVWGKPKIASTPVSNTDGATDAYWEPSKSSIRSQSMLNMRSNTRAETSDVRTESSKIPSYLRPPSYPSDPKRDPGVTLATSGDFTNTHFRTLNIIYAKSLRPRFHAPKAQEARLGIRRLLGEKFSIDETRAGLGVFEWVVGEREVRVVERFMREVEFGYISSGRKRELKWGWSEREVMERLFRIVVGEVVRAEEGRK